MRVSVLLGLSVLLQSVTVAAADERPTLSGRWSASALRSAWNIGEWSSACGPRPSGTSESGGIVRVTEQGAELSFSGPGRAHSTRQCWEQYPGLSTKSHVASGRSWRNVCKTGENDARQATVISSIKATDDTIHWDETGQYQFVVQNQTCTASVRRSRSFKLIERQAAAKPARPAPAGADTSSRQAPVRGKNATTSARCMEVGPPSRLEVRPSRKLMRPGETFTFRATVLDAIGCPVPTTVTWRLADDGAPVRSVGQGKVSVASDAAETEVELVASIAKRSVAVTIEVASNERYEALLRQRGLNESGESGEAAVAAIASGAIGARSVVTDDGGDRKRTRFALIIGVVALLLGATGLVLVRRRKSDDGTAMGGATGLAAAEQPRSVPREDSAGTLCPTCRAEYPPGAQFCAVDGNRLIHAQPAEGRISSGGVCPACGQGFDPGVVVCPQHNEELVPHAVYEATRATSGPAGRKICPICGTQYPGDGRFCGADGAALLPVN